MSWCNWRPQVMLLWDRVIGLDSLLPLPLLAAAILRFRWVAKTPLEHVPPVESSEMDGSQPQHEL